MQRALALDRIPTIVRTTINPAAFVAALRIGLPEAMKLFPDRLPILHISAHGSREGIQLSSGAVINWDLLRELVLPINQGLGGVLLLCMSACDGYNACQMAMVKDDLPHPYFAMVGHCGTPTWSDTAVAYASFYHLLSKGHRVPTAVAAMNQASGETQWVAELAEETKRGYLEYISSVVPERARQDIEASVDRGSVSDESKALEQ